MRFGFVTCVQLGLDCMDAIYDAGGQLDLAVTLHDELATRKAGRIYLNDFADRHDVPLVKCRNINDAAAVESLRAAQLDWLFIIGWSQIAGRDVLNSPQRGVIGMHPTLLPVGRGRASIPWAILKGLDATGVTMFVLDEGVDTGPILAQHLVPLSPSENATTLYDKIAHAHVRLMRDNWSKLHDNVIEPLPQDESQATYWPGRRPEDGYFDAGTSSTDEVDRLVRALTRPYPGAFTTLLDGQRLTIWEGTTDCSNTSHELHIRCRDGSYCPTDYSLGPVS